ncbi:carboxymuconolactone decarboxylase family protein [Edaphobacter sp. HDX4]|uniref:carboxymuconolactone decarboxylase family protein n=1 Tax=Edaphobacter sp. HDX4 TaxID=2794064 RepID=UPI002FE64D21
MATAKEPLFALQTIATAPDSSKPILEQVKKWYGFIPNLMAIFANSPTVLQGYRALHAIWEEGSFPPRERQLILLAASVENDCKYCAAAHSAIARGALPHTPEEVVAAIRNNTPVPEAKLNALVTLVKEIVRERGYASEKSIQRFIAAGYRKEQVMELLIGIALMTISNYLDHISPVPIDQAFATENE